MLWNLAPGWLLLAFVTVGILSFILAMALDAIMGESGFGAVGNALIITAGFFLAIAAADKFDVRLGGLEQAVAAGMGGSFVCLAALTVMKGLLERL